MDDKKYRYLFPYEKVPVGSKILIYGAGELGQDYLLQMEITNYCEVVALADKNFSSYPPMVVPVIDPKTIHEWSFDYVIIALRVAVAFNAIHQILEEQGVPEDRIICIYERNMGETCILSENDGESRQMLSCDDGKIAIALLITGGLGDHVIQKRLLMELMALAPRILIDIYAIRHKDFLTYLYSDCDAVKYVIDDLGSRYNINRGKYTISISIEACHYLRVDEYKEEIVKNVYPRLAKSMEILIRETAKEGIDLGVPVYVSNAIRRYKGLDAYSGFNYNGAFSIDDRNVTFPLTKRGEAFYRGLGISTYFTVNYGSGECQDIGEVAKMWPAERFEQTIALLKNQYPCLISVQLGAADAKKLKGVDRYILGESMEYVGSVLQHTLFHLDIEGGLVHIASQIGTKCVVLFGPTVEEYYGYKANINIRAGSCHNCWALYSDVNRCARDMEEPECMYSITPEMVADRIISYLSSAKEIML